MASVLVCADHQRAGDGLGRLLARAGFTRIQRATREDLVGRYAHGNVDIVFVVFHGMPHAGADTARQLLDVYPEANAVVVGNPRDATNLAAAVAAGARGFLRWDGPHSRSAPRSPTH